MNKNLLPLSVGVLFSMLLFSCVRDTDFGQAEEVTLTPTVELNLIHFDLDAGEFFDTNTGLPRLSVSDTVEIRFLDDVETQESLVRADFEFEFTNSIPRTFDVDLVFTTDGGEPTYATTTTVAAGTPEAPVETVFVEVIEGNSIQQLTLANKMAMTLTIPSADPDLQGVLSLQSKTTYYLEIKDRE